LIGEGLRVTSRGYIGYNVSEGKFPKFRKEARKTCRAFNDG
jgi:hypothetical protein